MSIKKTGLTLLAAALLSCYSLPALAGTASLTWVNAVTNTDGSPIPATGDGRLMGTTIQYGSCVGTPPNKAFGSVVGAITVAPGATAAQVSVVVVQEYCFRAFHTNSYGSSSDFSNVVVWVNPAPRPGPPTGLAVSSPVAYNVVKINDGFAMIPVGTVPVGTPCDSTQTVNGYQAVPASAVIWAGDIRPVVVVARCG